MPRKPSITKEQVFEAADKIWATNKTPTKERVREVLGNGSFATIHAYLQKWRSQQADTSNLGMEFTEMPDEVKAIATRLYSFAVQVAQDLSTNEQIETLEAENEEIRQRLAEYEEIKGKLQGLESAYRTLLDQYGTVSKQNEALSTKVKALEQENRALKAKNTKLEQCSVKSPQITSQPQPTQTQIPTVDSVNNSPQKTTTSTKSKTQTSTKSKTSKTQPPKSEEISTLNLQQFLDEGKGIVNGKN